MWLAVDCGNSRIKWAAVENGRPSAVQAERIAPRRSSSAFLHLRKAAADAAAARVSHVGRAMSRGELRGVLRACPRVRFVKPAAAAGGVVNRYCPPSSLGVDRWLSLVAARGMRRDVAVVCAGTAATIDFMRADGVFIGGAILPGLSLLRAAAARRTGLPIVEKKADMTLPPRSTRDALSAGAAAAVVGASLFLRRRILPGARFVVGGGDAESLLPWLPRSAAHMPHPPICGLVRLYAAKQ